MLWVLYGRQSIHIGACKSQTVFPSVRISWGGLTAMQDLLIQCILLPKLTASVFHALEGSLLRLGKVVQKDRHAGHECLACDRGG